MRRLHVISTPEHEMGGEIYYRESDFMHDPELHRAYKCGVKQGWREAMHEAEREREPYHERHYPTHGGHILYREHDMIPEHEGIRNPDWDEVVYRRRRDSRGRYM